MIECHGLEFKSHAMGALYRIRLFVGFCKILPQCRPQQLLTTQAAEKYSLKKITIK
jgi:hypothetical protein